MEKIPLQTRTYSPTYQVVSLLHTSFVPLVGSKLDFPVHIRAKICDEKLFRRIVLNEKDVSFENFLGKITSKLKLERLGSFQVC